MKSIAVIRFSLTVLLAAAFLSALTARGLELRIEANVMVELKLTSTQTYADPFNDVTVDGIFVDPNGRELRVPAFWAGTNLWKVRFASAVLGTHRFRSECSDPMNPGLHGVTALVEVRPYRGSNVLYLHGPLRVASNRRFLEHTDGTPFFWLGDTWWMGLCHRLHWPDEFKTLTADRKAKGFNVIQMVAGLYPDMYPFDERGANEAGHPWETNYARIRPQYFDAADERIEYLVEQGFTPCLVGAWGYFMPWMGVEKAKQHWRYLVARYGALPVVWCVAGEANLPWYQAAHFPFDDRKQVQDWTEVARSLKAVDPYHRLITIHPTGIGRLSARHAIDDLSLLDIDLLQTPHGEREAVAPTIRTVRESYADQPVMPVINGEASYEMLNGHIAAEWPRAMFWICLLNGAAGHTYGANGIWQCNRPEQPHGSSPTKGSPPAGYGATPWNEAMNFAGSRQIGLGKQLLEEFPWWRFTPHPEWAEYVGAAALSLDDAQWIWFPEGAPAQDAPTEKRFLRKRFIVPPGKSLQSARLFVSADDKVFATLNGAELGGHANWRTGRSFNDVGHLLHSGTNVLAMTVENLPSDVAKNPAGFLSVLELRFNDAGAMRILSDNTWRCSKSEAADWTSVGFDDTAWASALVLGRYGAGPWGKIGENAQGEAPQAAGVLGQVRVIYALRAEAIRVLQLGAGQAYTATYFDPVGGEKSSLGIIHSDAQGTWTCPPPARIKEHDWVLLLQEPGH